MLEITVTNDEELDAALRTAEAMGEPCKIRLMPGEYRGPTITIQGTSLVGASGPRLMLDKPRK